jgi:hypothetical protein
MREGGLKWWDIDPQSTGEIKKRRSEIQYETLKGIYHEILA